MNRGSASWAAGRRREQVWERWGRPAWDYGNQIYLWSLAQRRDASSMAGSSECEWADTKASSLAHTSGEMRPRWRLKSAQRLGGASTRDHADVGDDVVSGHGSMVPATSCRGETGRERATPVLSPGWTSPRAGRRRCCGACLVRRPVGEA